MADETTDKTNEVNETEETEEQQQTAEEQDSTDAGSEEKPDEKDSTEEADEDGDTDKDGDDEDDSALDELPEWARKRMSKANSEAAKYRNQLRDVQQRLEGAKTPEEFEAATKELATANRDLELNLARERALRKHDLSDDDLIFLTASSAEDIEKQAKALATRAGSAGARRLKGGLVPDEGDSSPDDPRELARLTRRH